MKQADLPNFKIPHKYLRFILCAIFTIVISIIITYTLFFAFDSGLNVVFLKPFRFFNLFIGIVLMGGTGSILFAEFLILSYVISWALGEYRGMKVLSKIKSRLWITLYLIISMVLIVISLDINPFICEFSKNIIYACIVLIGIAALYNFFIAMVFLLKGRQNKKDWERE